MTDTPDAQSNFDAYIEGLSLNAADRDDLRRAFENRLTAFTPAPHDPAEDAPTPPAPQPVAPTPPAQPYSVVAWARGLLQDLGLSLGWAALYFSAFTARWQGQTPGKRLLRIRVQLLGGGRIGWWDAFSRYGGYGAGFATGLLGFLQVYWDPNRQAIQDKIAGTVVIFLPKAAAALPAASGPTG